MTEKIGLEAVLSLGSFSHAVSQYNSAISGMSKNTASTASSISSSFVGLGSGILKVGAIAAGAGLAGIAALTGGLLLLGSAALTEFAKYERMSLSIESLVARQLSQGEQVEQQRTVAIGLTKKEAAELDGLAAKIEKEELARATLHARIKEQSEALRQLRDAHGADALDVQTATARLAELENKYNSSGAAIDKLKGRQDELSDTTGRYATVIEKVRTGQMSMTEAMAQAGPKAKELLGWISKLAINSPFSEEGVNLAFQTALAYGFTIDKAKELTAAELDFAAATGKSVEVTNMIALALGQMQAKGKVSGQEIIQLTNAGIGVNKILEDMGFTLDDVSNGLVDSDKFIQAVIDDMNVFKGAGAAQAATFSGLISTLGDLKAIGLREFFTGTFTTIQPYLADFVSGLTSAALETGRIRELGDVLGTYVAAGIQKVVDVVGQMKELFGAFQTGGAVGLVAALGITPDAISLFEKFRGMITQVAETIAGPLMAAFSGLSTGGVLDTINQSITFLNEHFVELQGALLGIGAILATGVFAAIAAGVFSIITPFTLLGAAVVLFSTAWAGNWGNIQGIAQQALAVLTTVFNTLSAVALSLANTIKTNVWPPLQEAFNNITLALNNMGLTWGDVWNALATATKVVAGTVGVLLLGLIGSIVGLVSGFASAFATITSYLTDFQNAIGLFVKGITTLFTGLVTITSGLLIGDLGMVFEGVKQSVSGLFDTLEGLGDFLLTAMKASLGSVFSFVKGWMASFTGFFDGLAPALGKKFENTWEAIREVWRPEKWFELGESIITGILEGIEKNQDKVLEILKGLAASALQAAGDALGWGSPARKFIPLGESIPQGVVLGINNTSGLITQAMNNLVDVDRFAQAGRSVMQRIAGGIGLEGGSIKDAILGQLDFAAKWFHKKEGLGAGERAIAKQALFDAFDQTFGGIVAGTAGENEFLTAFGRGLGGLNPQEIGEALGVASDHISEIIGTIRSQFGPLTLEMKAQAVSMASSFSGIAGGFAGMVQDQIDGFNKAREEANKLRITNQGLTESYSEQQNKLATLQEELARLTTGNGQNAMAIEKTTEALAFGERQLAIYNEELAALTPDTLPWDKKKLAIDKLTETMDMQRQELEKLQAQNEIDTLTIDKKTLAITELTGQMDKNRETIAKNEAALKKHRLELERQAFTGLNPFAGGQEELQGDLAMIELLQEFLAGTGQELRLVGEELGGIFAGSGLTSDILHNRISAQETLNQLLAEQAERERQIAEQQKAQQQLSFLQQQIDLLKLGQGLGIDVFKGMTFGLNASASDLLAATNAIVQAMVNEINTSLQMGSPSRLMIKTFKQVMAGAAIGLERGQSLLSDAVRSIPILNGSIPQPVFSQAGGVSSSSSSTYNYNFPMTVNTAASAPAVVRQYEIKRSMYAASS